MRKTLEEQRRETEAIKQYVNEQELTRFGKWREADEIARSVFHGSGVSAAEYAVFCQDMAVILKERAEALGKFSDEMRERFRPAELRGADDA